MALALTAFRAQMLPIDGPTRKRGIQRLVWEFTGAATDVTIDLGTYAGTFWTAITTDQRGKDILALVKTIAAQGAAYAGIYSPQLGKRVQVATLSAAGQFTIATITNNLPNIAVNAADGETSWFIACEIAMKDGIFPTVSEYSANNT